MTDWLDDAARGLADGSYNRRQIVARGGAILAGCVLATLTKPVRALARPTLKTCGEQRIPDDWECCDDVAGYDPRTHTCCEPFGETGLVCADSEGGCCGPHHCTKDICKGSKSVCCNNLLAGRGTCYDPTTHVCCSGYEVCTIQDGCCGNVNYGRSGRIATCTSHFCKQPGERCCRSKNNDFCFDPKTHFCCPAPTQHPCPTGYHCCGTEGCCNPSTEECCHGTCVPKGHCRPQDLCGPNKQPCPTGTICCPAGICAPAGDCSNLCSGCISNATNMCCFGDCVNSTVPATGDYTSTSCCTPTGKGRDYGYLGDVSCTQAGGTTRASCCKGGKPGCICKSGECCIVGPSVCHNETGRCVPQ